MVEAKIKEALIRFHAAIKNADGAGLSAALNDVEALQAAHATELSPQLAHFLSGRSYAKALAYLGGDTGLAAKPSSPPGGCGGGHA